MRLFPTLASTMLLAVSAQAQNAPPPPAANSASVAAAPAPQQPTQKVICRRIPRIGSLAGFDRVCRTKTEWQDGSDASARKPPKGAGENGLL